MKNILLLITALLGGVTLFHFFYPSTKKDDEEDYPVSKYEDEKDYEENPWQFVRCISCKRLIRLWGMGTKNYQCEYCGTKQRH